MIQILIGGAQHTQLVITNVIQCLIIDAKCFIGVLAQLMCRQCGIVGLNNYLGYLCHTVAGQRGRGAVTSKGENTPHMYVYTNISKYKCTYVCVYV